jgi:SpoVK/Ycf46/Vps4 family AAA+-type ATPase
MLNVADRTTKASTTHAYATSWDYICDELKRLELLIRLLLLTQNTHQTPGPLDQFKGLVLTENEISSLLIRLGKTTGAPDDIRTDQAVLMNELSRLDSEIDAKLSASLINGTYLSLHRISELFALTPFEERCLIASLAPEVDRSYEKLYAYLQDDVTRKKPSIDLLMKLQLSSINDRLHARSAFESNSSLFKFRLLQIVDESPVSTPLISRFVKLDDRIVEFLLGNSQIDARIRSMATLSHSGAAAPVSTSVNEGQSLQIREFVKKRFAQPDDFRETLALYFCGPYGSGRRALAAAISADLQLPLVTADGLKLSEGAVAFDEAVWLCGREALLQPAILCVDNFDHLTSQENGSKVRLDLFLEMIRSCSWLTILFGTRPWSPQGSLGDCRFIPVRFDAPDELERKVLWEFESQRGFQLSSDVDPGALASKFRLSQEQIRDALVAAESSVALRSPEQRPITSKDLDAACRAQSSEKLNSMARKVVPGYGWDDIVLPDDVLRQLSEICQRVVYRHRVLGDWGFGQKLSLGKGVNALFAGPSGTGKTMATEIVASELGLDLYKIDLSGVVSKYIGETERNLDRIFTAAEDANAILFFDEADALFGKRSEVRDSHDRYANIEISYLLQKMEEYEGLAILATNLKANLDEAFTRRLAFTVHFPFPDESSRLLIWKGIWPASISLDATVDLGYLAQQFKLSGGNIKNIALAAAFLAAETNGPVTMAHLLHATRREFQKLGKPIASEQQWATR